MVQKKRVVFRFQDMIRSLRQAISRFPDKRTGKNTTYEMMDAAAGAFSVFFTQCGSFLAHQKLLQERYGLSNAKTLFGMQDIPTDNHIRDLLDPVASDTLDTVFADCFAALARSGDLASFRTGVGNNDLLIALDGTWYFSSQTIHCRNCSTKTKNGETSYYHGMVNPALVTPGKSQVIALPPVCVLPQDGDKKQDCENKAGKRWLKRHGKTYAPLHITLLGDDLYCHQPMCETIRASGFNFILVCKPDSHRTLYEWLKGITQEYVVRKPNKNYHEVWTYQYCSDVPLKDGEDGLPVNWCELTIVREEDGKQLYKNAFVTNHPITRETVETIITCGRTRWKIENENNNTLKTKGYHLEHNYGHGRKHLASLLATMNVLAFLFHTMLEFMDEKYRLLRKTCGARTTLFNEIRALLKYLCFRSFDRLMEFMVESLEQLHDPALLPVPV